RLPRCDAPFGVGKKRLCCLRRMEVIDDVPPQLLDLLIGNTVVDGLVFKHGPSPRPSRKSRQAGKVPAFRPVGLGATWTLHDQRRLTGNATTLFTANPCDRSVASGYVLPAIR